MSTTARGSAFEDKVFEALRKEVEGDRLGLSPNACTIYQRRGYYSRDRDSEIRVDIAIEVWIPSATNWSLLWVCECKDYTHALPVDDVEEFKAKLDQIAGKNVKGLLAVTGAIQSGALAYARANGIGIVRILPDDQVRWLMYLQTVLSHTQINPRDFERAFVTPGYLGENESFFGNTDGYLFDSWNSLLRTSLVPGEA